MHEAAEFIESLVNKKLAPGYSSVYIQSFFTLHMNFGTEIKSDVRVDIEQGLAGTAFHR